MIRRAKRIVSYIFPIVLEREKGEVVPHVQVNVNRGKYTLDGETVNYSFGSLYGVFDKAFEYFNLRGNEVNTALILGFGAGGVAQIITQKYNADCHIIGVEKDGVILKHAAKHFNFEKHKNLKVVHADAVDFVQNSNDKYDLVVIDLFVENRVPDAFKQKEFLRSVKNLLKEDSMVFFHKIAHNLETKKEANKLASNMQEVFGRTLTQEFYYNSVESIMLVYQTHLVPMVKTN